jgi:hypothetical protein
VGFAAHLRRVVEVEVVGDHRLRVAFDDGVGGEIDASNWTWRGVSSHCAIPPTSLVSSSIGSLERSAGPTAPT